MKHKNKFKQLLREFLEPLSIQGYKKKLLQNSVKRKNNYLKHNLHINNIESKIKIFWLKNEQMINDQLVMLKELDYYLCYFINRQFTFNSLEFKMSFDLVIVDLSWNVQYLHPNFLPNQVLNPLDKLHHIFILAPNSIKALNIQLGDTVCVVQKLN